MLRNWSAEFLEEKDEIKEMLEDGSELGELAEERGNVFTWYLTTRNTVWDEGSEEILTNGNHVGDAKDYADIVEEKAEKSKKKAGMKAAGGISLSGSSISYAVVKPGPLSFLAAFGANVIGARLIDGGLKENINITRAENAVELADNYMNEQEKMGNTGYTVKVTDSYEIEKAKQKVVDEEQDVDIYVIRE